MELKSLNCPNCGGAVNIPEGVSRFFCTYCGSQIQIDDGKIIIDLNANINANINLNQQYRYTDVARLKELELQEKERERRELAEKKEKLKPIWWIVYLLIWILISAIIIFITFAADLNSVVFFILFLVLWLGGTAVFWTVLTSKHKSIAKSAGCALGFGMLFSSLLLILGLVYLLAALFGISLAA